MQDTDREGTDLVFGDTSTKPFQSDPVNKRAPARRGPRRASEKTTRTPHQQGGIRPIGLQDCRHTAVSQMLDAGIAINTVSKFIGHASITITIDRYGHLLPGGEADAIARLDAYHQRTQSE
ncbi:MAG: tyrosine-type recombinase/integrase [Solirubrobacteraceae bacterium]